MPPLPMMSSRREFARSCLLIAGVLTGGAASQTSSDSLTGQLLVASPAMDDPRFSRTVILIIQHDVQGAFGVAINRPAGEKSIAEILAAVGADFSGVRGTISVFVGGPLQTSIGFVVHSGEYRLPATIMLTSDLAVTSASQVLRDIGTGRGPRKRMMMFGYAGWAPGQLDGELALGAWVVASATPDVVFDMDRAAVWDAAFQRQTVRL